MSTRVADRVDGWEQRSVSGGYRGLQDLADAEFSGVVRAGGAELYMTKGTVIDINGGSIEDFEGTSGTSYRAPSPALPLLAVMQRRSDEVRAKYYTEETPMSGVDRTLSDGGFTGYVELSENVLSGDYYLVYHQGRSMSVAFVGNSQQLVDGDEAFETADDEVGIYEVRPVEVEAIEIPDPEPAPSTGPSEGTTAPATSEAAERGDEGSGEAGKTVTDSRNEPEGRTEATEPETAASESGDAGAAGADASAEPEGVTSDPERAGAGRADQSGAREEPNDQPGAADSRDETATGPSTEPSGAAGRDAGGAGAEPGGTGTGRGTTEPDGESPTGSAREGPASGGPGREPRQEPEPGPGQGIRESDPEQASARQGMADTETDEPTPGREPTSAGDPSAGTDESPTSGSAPRSDTRPPKGELGEETGPSSGAGGDRSRTEQTSEEAGVALERRSVPSLDPARTAAEESNGGGETSTGVQPGPTGRTAAGAGPQGGESPPSTSAAGAGPEAGGGGRPAPDRDTGASRPEQSGGDPDREAATVDDGPTQETQSGELGELREKLADRDAELDRLETELAEETERREELQAEVADLREEREELAAEVDRLEAELERVEEEFGVATGAQQRLTPAEALGGTDLFVRYQSKNGTTLTDAHDGEGRREDVTENLRLEQHTQFEAGDVAVDGQDYDTFIRSRVEYQFVTWLVEDLLFEVRDTGGADGLADLYDALPEVDRAELNGTIAVRYTEDGTEQRGQETFDIVLRDRMGDPLFVANLNDSREGATGGMMEGLITTAERVGGSKDTLAGAFLVTESFFEPEALETAAEATKGGLLSRDKRKSFVNLSRKRGYHLCLVEARNQNFHLAVPEL